MWLIGLFWFLYAFDRPCSGYNVEVSKVGMSQGSENGSQFGYSVVFVNDEDWDPAKASPVPNKWLLAGAPNLKVDGIRGHGDVYKCGPTTMKDQVCIKMNMKDPIDMCSKLKGGKPTRSHCEEDSRMGATMTLNRKYSEVYREFTTTPMVTMCAPGWKSVYKEDNDKFEKYMFGMCLKIKHDHSVLPCSRYQEERKYTLRVSNSLDPDETQMSLTSHLDPNCLQWSIQIRPNYCWPFWGGNEKGQEPSDDDGRAVFAYAIGGFSAAFTNDGISEVIGAPGVNRNRGAYRAYQKRWLVKKEWHDKPTTYYGYALTSGTFESGADLAVGNPNFYTSGYGHRGRVDMRDGTILKMIIDFGSGWTTCKFLGGTDEAITSDMRQIKMQVGSKFGAALAAVDISGDGFDELFIGAPLYSDNYVEEGRVFVFNSSGDLCVLGILSGAAKMPLLEDQTSFGRFGTSISTAGDLDGDGFNDVVIGAPYENGGSGAVYIYSGIGKCNCHMPDKYSQRIVGKALDSGMRSFGFSVFGGGDDVDNNGFPDLAVGAYASDKAFILRSRPVATVTASLRMHPQPIPLVATKLECSENKTYLCFFIDMVIKYEDGPGNENRAIQVMIYLDADTKYKKNENGRSRIVFRENKLSVLNSTYMFYKGQDLQQQYTLDVLPGDKDKPEPRDPWTTVQISGYYELVPTAGNDFSKLDHILSKKSRQNFSTEADFDKKCDNIADCTSDLDLKVDLHLLGGGQSEKVTNDTVIYVDDKNQMEMIMEVTNKLNTSYRSNVSADVSAVLRRDVFQDGAISAECKYELYKMPTKMNCTAQEELDKNEDMRVKTNFDISRARLVPETETLDNMQQFVNISVETNQGNTDEDLSNNVFNLSIPVMIKSEIDITVDTQTSRQVRYNADPESSRVLYVRHIYYITNNGPSFLPKTYVNISIPYKRNGETFARVQASSLCSERGRQVQITTAPPTTEGTTAKDYDIDDTEKQRKRREVDPSTAKQSETSGEKKEQTSKIRNITCEEYECIVLECKLVEMERSDTKTIDLSITVAEKEIAREKGVRTVRFVTNASATPPTVWFSGKVVPWDKPEEESKTTNFIVEPASVVTEVNIWIIIGSVLGAVALLIIIMVILWKTGFFRRKKQQQLRKLRQESLYKRRSQVRPTSTMSTSKTNQPYKQIEASEDKS